MAMQNLMRLGVPLRARGGGVSFVDTFDSVLPGWIGPGVVGDGKLVISPNKGSNQLANAGFEDWLSETDLDSWAETIAGSSTITRDSATPRSGNFAVRMDIDVSSSNAQVAKSATAQTVGEWREWQVYARSVTGDASAVLGSSARFPSGDLANALDTTYRPLVVTGYCTGSTVSTLIKRTAGSASASTSFVVDDASFVPISGLFHGRKYVTPHGRFAAHIAVRYGTQAGLFFHGDAPDNPQNYDHLFLGGDGKLYWNTVVAGVPTPIGSATVEYVEDAALEAWVYADGTFDILYNGTVIALGVAATSNAGSYWGLFSTHAETSFSEASADPVWRNLWVEAGALDTNIGAGRGDTLVLYSATSLYQSQDEAASKTIIPFDVVGSETFPAAISVVEMASDGSLLVFCVDSHIYRSKATTWDTGFESVYQLPNSYPMRSYGTFTSGPVVMCCEYTNNVDQAHLSKDNGLTWEPIFQIPAPLDLGVNNHIHNVGYDPYDDVYWVVTGDGDNRNIYYSTDEGDNWTAIGSIPGNMIQVVPLPDRIVFLTDMVAAGAYAFERGQPYNAANLNRVWTVVNDTGGDVPIPARPSVHYGSGARAYIAWHYSDADNAALAGLWVTRDGLEYELLARAPVAPAGAGPFGAWTVTGPLANGYVYLECAGETTALVRVKA